VSFNNLVERYDLQYDIEDLIKKHNYDLNRLEPGVVEGMRGLTASGKLYGLPTNDSGSLVVLYNRDLFDRFGQDYPVDMMTWDEIYQVAQRMTRVEDNVIYRGFITSF